MSHTASVQPHRRVIDRNGVRRIIQVVATLLIVGVLLFLSAGTFNWPGAWTYLVIYALALAVNAYFMYRTNPALINERGKRHADTKAWDRTLVRVMTPLSFSLPILAGLDVRNGWTGQPAAWVIVGGAALVLFGNLIAMAAILANPFFETTVRIQADREHRVVSSGPYRLVRHPGYVGLIVYFAGMPLVLGTWVAAIPALGLIAAMILRTALEDRTLQAELPGYADYARRVTYRLLPGIW
ncbi:MAG: isoprenylcysteine carboxylmethyltransferase family protein [Anaerolineae bacterium]|nr:isoprenylcysteine carboxylmethyltransferase family protein [Anaerolineae bacterium]